MENLGDLGKRALPADPNFNFLGSCGDEQREGSIAFSDISFPSHVSDLESFHSEGDISLHSHITAATAEEHSERRHADVHSSQRQGNSNRTNNRSLPDLPDQASENIDVLLAALRAATMQGDSGGSDKGSNGRQSETTSSSVNLDSSRFISKESFPESVLAESSESWSKDASLNPEELGNQPSSTPFCAERFPPAVKQDADSRLSEKFFAPSKTPEDQNEFVGHERADSNPWSFSGGSILLQTPVPDENTFNPAKSETSSKPISGSKTLPDESVQKKLWSEPQQRSSASGQTFHEKNKTFGNFEATGGYQGQVFNPFDSSSNDSFPATNVIFDDGQDTSQDPGFSLNQDVGDDFGFQSADDAIDRLNKDEEEFLAEHQFDKGDAMVPGDMLMFSSYILPDGLSKSGRRSVIGINDPDDKGEVRVSFGDFFGARTEELGSLGEGDENRARPQFSGTDVKVSPAACPPRPLYRPSSPEGSEECGLSRKSSENLKQGEHKAGEPAQRKASRDRRRISANDETRRSSPYGAEDLGKKKDAEKEKERIKQNKKQKQKQNPKDKATEESAASDTSSNKSRKISAIDPNGSTLAALKLCQSSQGSKLLGMSSNELKSLSSALAKTTKGDSREIYQVILDFINRERRLSQAGSEFNEDTQNLTDVFYSEKIKTDDKSTPGRELAESTDGVTFYHSDTSSDVSPGESKFDAARCSTPSPPLDTSSPKSTGSSIAVQTESRGCDTAARQVAVALATDSSKEVQSLGGYSKLHNEASGADQADVIKTTNNAVAITNTYQSDMVTMTSRTSHRAPVPGTSYLTPVAKESDPMAATGTSYPVVRSEAAATGTSYPVSVMGTSYPMSTTATNYAASVSEMSYPPSVTTTGTGYLSHATEKSYRTVGTGISVPSVPVAPTGTNYLAAAAGTSYPSHATGTSYRPAETGTSYPTISTGITYPPSALGATYPMRVTGTSYPGPVTAASDFPPLTMLSSLPGVEKASEKSRTGSGEHVMFHTKTHFANRSLEAHPRSAFHTQSFFPTRVPGASQERTASLNDVPGFYNDELLTEFSRAHVWSGATLRPHGHREEGDWNWRTQRTSQIQMVIPPMLDFPGVLCVGLTAEAHLAVHNPTSRWIRCSSVIMSCTVNGLKVDHHRDCPFSIRETTLIGPKLTEKVKVEFSCLGAGIYIAQIQVVSTPVGANDVETSSALVTVQGFSEEPMVEIVADEGQTLEFGELHHGYNSVRPLRILNKGRTAVPLKMLICSSSCPGMFVFAKNNSADEIQKLEMQSTTLKCLLPANNDLSIKPEPLTIWIELVGKNQHCFEKTDPAEIFDAGINIQLDTGTVAKILGNVQLRGVVGFTRIQIPKAFQMAMCLSSPVGQQVTRQMPFSNAGNICSDVELTIPKYTDVFTVTPNKFQVRPGTAVMVEVGFIPRMKGSYESVIQVSELANTKSYEVLLRGSSVEPEPDNDGPPILSNKSWLCWTGVDIGQATHQRLFLLNDSSEQSIHFQAVILGEHSDFEIQRMKSDYTTGGKAAEQMLLRPKERMPVYVLFSPSSFGVCKSALVLKPDRGPRFQIPLHAYGGTSHLSISDANNTSDGYVADLGQVSLGHRNILKVTLKNSGSRAAFVKAVCYADFEIRLHFPQTHLSIVPSEFILPERSSKELVIVYQPLQNDARACQSQVKRVATVVFYSGDEVMRQWYNRSLTKHHEFGGRRSSGKYENIRFDKVFQDQNCVAEDFSFPDLENWQEVFDDHVSQMVLNLIGGNKKLSVTSVDGDEERTMVMETPRIKHTKESRALIRNSTPAQKESVIKENLDNTKTASWSLIPEQLSLKVSYQGSVDSTKKVQLLNFSNRPLEFEFIWPAHCIAVTPHIGTIPAKNQTLVHVSVWPSILTSGVELPWRGSAYVNCDGAKKPLAIQIHKHLVCDDSPAPAEINKPLAIADPEKDNSLLFQTYSKPQMQNQPLKVTPKMMEFPKTEVKKTSSSVVTLENVSPTLLRWKISSVAPAYARVSETSTEIFRATYPVFRFSTHSGLIRPGQIIKVDVVFQTRDPGDYCQMWDVQTNSESPLTSTKTQMELSGKAVPPTPPSNAAERRRNVRVSDPVREKGSATAPSGPSQELPSKQSPEREKGAKTTIIDSAQDLRSQQTELTKTTANVYVEPEVVQFPDTEVGETSTAKIKICNKSSTGQQFRIVSPQAPFSTKGGTSFSTKPSHYIRVSAFFSPEEPSKNYDDEVVFANCNSGELLSVKLRGKSVAK